jgi:sortase (surface protein transpeptidase)
MVHQYSVIDTEILDPQSPEAFAHADRDLLTLVTCRGFDSATGTYLHRILVRAVLVSVHE